MMCHRSRYGYKQGLGNIRKGQLVGFASTILMSMVSGSGLVVAITGIYGLLPFAPRVSLILAISSCFEFSD